VGDRPAPFRDLLAAAIDRRGELIKRGRTQAFRVFSGGPEGLEGVLVDVYGPFATLIVHEGAAPARFDAVAAASDTLAVLSPLGVRAVYHKPFAKDRSRMGGEMPEGVTDPTPAAGEPQPEAVVIREHGWSLEVRPFDGLSTGLFLDQRENRAWVASWVRSRVGERQASPAVLNTFAYTCAFSVAAATAGAITTSVDVSPRYLEWGRRNFAHNGLDAAAHRFAKMDTLEFIGYAKRKGLRYDLVILDPPSFAAGSKRKGIPPWSSVDDYAKLVKEAASLLNPKGVIFASTNTRELCRPGRLEREVREGLGREPRLLRLPAPPSDFAAERGRFAAVAFS
jgi:23S rRNA (cytosine1962-C5)-methyltransferase